MCKYLPKVHLHTKSYQDRFRNKKVFSCVPHLLWKWPWSNGVWKMNLLEAGGCNFWARMLIFGYVLAQFIVLKSYYWHFLYDLYFSRWTASKTSNLCHLTVFDCTISLPYFSHFVEIEELFLTIFDSRFWMMDPNSLGLLFSWKLATPSDQAEMAESLRRVNRMEFKRGVGVHSSTMSADDFRKSVDACWNWLDGRPLIWTILFLSDQMFCVKMS